MNAINNNPFRILGVPSNATARDIAANQSRLKAYLAASKLVSFPLDGVGGLPSLTRNEELVSQATANINLPQDKLTHALFWFIKPEDSVGSMAWEYLLKGDVDKAIELFAKRDTFASIVNRGVLAFIAGDSIAGITCMGKMLQDAELRTGFVKAVTDTTFQITEDEFAELFFSNLFEELDAFAVYQNIVDSVDSWTAEHVRKYSIEKPVSFIEKAIAKAKSTKGKDPTVWWNAGNELRNSTHKARLQLIKLVGVNDTAFQRLADMLANQILQCSIYYFNNSDESREYVLNAKELAEYSAEVAIGKLMKERCEKAVETLAQKERDLPPAEVEQEVFAIIKELKEFCERPNKIEHSVTLLNNTKSKLQSVKAKLGSTNSYYLRLSSQVVNNALHNVIEEVNASQEALASLGSFVLDLIKPTFKAAWDAILIMDQFDLDDSFKERYSTNRRTLKDLCGQIGISTSTYRPPTSSTRTPPSSTSSSSSYSSPSYSSSSSSSSSDFWDEHGGCIIQIIIYGIIALCIATCN